MKYMQWMLSILMIIGTTVLTSCSSSDDDNNNNDGGNTTPPEVTWEEPTTDQMAVRVTADLTVASLSEFANSSTGAALIRRLPKVTGTFTNDTEMVLLKGSDVGSQSDEVILKMAILLNYGGYVALERPTQGQLDAFMEKTEAAMAKIVEEAADELFDLTPEEQAATVNASMAGRMALRRENLMNHMRAAGADKACAEIIIFGPYDCYFEEPLDVEGEVTTYFTDCDGNIVADETSGKADGETGWQLTDYHYGLVADGAAQWLNDIEAQFDEEDAWYEVEGVAARRAPHRASGTKAINDIMNASETFTKSGQMYFRASDASKTSGKSDIIYRTDRVMMTLRTWGVHDVANHKDFYYVNQNVLLRMGNSGEFDPFFCRYYSATDWMTEINKDGKATGNLWYGNFLTQYDTSMDLQPVDSKTTGVIHCEAATPETANQMTTQSVNATTSHSRQITTSHSFSFMGGVQGGTFGVEGRYDFKRGTNVTDGNSFAMTNSKSIKDLDVVKNTNGTEVKWTYKGRLPKTSGAGNKTHEQPAEILVNDANLVNDACWSVENAVGQYAVNIGSYPVTGVLLLNSKGVSSVQHTKTTFDNNWVIKLAQPARAVHTWRMYVRVLEWREGFQQGAQSDLQQALIKKFPDLYQSVFEVGELTDESLQNATGIITYTKNVFDVYKDILQAMAKSFGIKKFSVTWSSDKNRETKQGYEVVVE